MAVTHATPICIHFFLFNFLWRFDCIFVNSFVNVVSTSTTPLMSLNEALGRTFCKNFDTGNIFCLFSFVHSGLLRRIHGSIQRMISEIVRRSQRSSIYIIPWIILNAIFRNIEMISEMIHEMIYTHNL